MQLEALPASPRRRIHTPKAVPDLSSLPPDALLTRQQVATLAGVAYRTLRNWETLGKGPRTARIEGLPRYRAEDVRAWLRAA